MENTKNWPELAIGLYDKLTGRDAEISYEFNRFELDVPSKAGTNSDHATWRMNGQIKIKTQNNGVNN